MAQGATLSDLHLFSHHARPERYFSWIEAIAGYTDLFVLNGDIFDFKWSEHGIFSRSVLAAKQYLQNLLERHPDCHFVVTLGNHDAVLPYIDALQELATTHGNFEWHEFVYFHKTRLFLHGDVIHAGCSNSAVRKFRNRLQQPAKNHALKKFAHSAMYHSRVPWAAYRVLPNRILASRILTYLENENFLSNGDLQDIYFGHTHCAFVDFQYRGYRFHNTGSATHGSRLNVVRFQLQ